MHNLQKVYFIFFMLSLSAREDDDIAHVIEGNLALPSSQQPVPLFCFGQNIVNKNDTQLFLYGDYLRGKNINLSEVTPTFLYGIKDNLSLYLSIPVATQLKINNKTSSGLEDMVAQLEYAFYNDDHPTYANQATIVGNISLPTGSPLKSPQTGLGTPSFFLGFTASHTGTAWYYFLSAGGTFTIPYNNQKNGNTIFYECGLGRNIYYEPSKKILTLTLEVSGIHNKKNTTAFRLNHNSGGSNLSIGPCLWFATQRFILEAGIIFPVLHSVKNQPQHSYLFALELGWKFNS